MNELNPNHPVVNEMRDQYHKLLAFMIWRYGPSRGTHRCESVTITPGELDRFIQDNPDGINLVVHPKGDVLMLRVVDDAEGARLAREAGGLPS